MFQIIAISLVSLYICNIHYMFLKNMEHKICISEIALNPALGANILSDNTIINKILTQSSQYKKQGSIITCSEVCI